MFENLQLGAYGNRIPSLSFEVIADEADVRLDAVIRDIAPAQVLADCPTLLAGFAASGDTARAVLDVLAEGVPFYATEVDGALMLREASLDAGEVSAASLGAEAGEAGGPRLTRTRKAGAEAPTALSIRHYDPARDYQPGVQRVWRGVDARRELTLELPASLSASAALALAERQMATLAAGRVQAEISLPWRYLGLAPGSQVRVPGLSGAYRVVSTRFEAMALRVSLQAMPTAPPLPINANAGRYTAEADLVPGPTRLLLVDLPMLTPGVAAVPQVFVAAAGVGSGWRKADLLLSLDDGLSWDPIGQTAAPAIIGTAETLLQPGSPCAFDDINALDVTLVPGSADLLAVDDDALIAGRNLALVGQELIQFGVVTPLGPHQFRLSRLLRGRRGTEWAQGEHHLAERFLLIERDTLLPISVPVGTASVRVLAHGLGDLSPVEATLLAPGQALEPLSPIALTAEHAPNGELQFAWIRRSRDGWRWNDGVDAPLVEESERYQVALEPNVGLVRGMTVNEPRWTYALAEQNADTASGAATVTVRVAQIGTHTVSRSVTLLIAL
jgi:Putative phage tail protein